jgi:hypothetical protein
VAPIVKRILLLAGACALALLASAAAAPGDPALARMALELSDLPVGTSLDRQRYVREEGCVSAYERSFDVDGRRYGRTRLLSADSDLCLFAAVAAATKEMRGWLSFLMSAPRSEIEEIYDDEETDRIRLLRRRTLKVGDGAVEILVRYRFLGEMFYSSFTVTRVSRALGYLNTFSGGPIAAGDVTRLAGVFANRMRDGFVPAIATPPVIAGLAEEGQTLTASAGTWRNSPTRFAYQWRRCDAAGAACTAVAGANARTYAVAVADVGSTLRVEVTARNASGSRISASAQTALVTAVTPPVNTAPPTISGTAQQSQTLTGATGTWAGSPTNFAYQWQRCDPVGLACVNVTNATGPTYGVGAGDAGSGLRLAVTATNAVGSATALSAPTAVVP